MPARTPDGKERGYVIPIGGAEDRVGDRDILERFVNLLDKRKRIAIIPTASQLEETGEVYEALFRELGARCRVLDIKTRQDAEDGETLRLLEGSDGVFLTGGNQLRLSTIIGGTSVARVLRRRNAEGMAVAGTSAGAAIMPEHMIAGGETGATPQGDMTTLAAGLGLTNKVLIDQHFRQRDRIGRLLSALAYNPYAVGFGIDEDTAAFIDPDDRVTVVGSGAITVLDPSEVKFSGAAETRVGDAVCILDLRLHVLTAGARFDLNSRTPTPPGLH